MQHELRSPYHVLFIIFFRLKMYFMISSLSLNGALTFRSFRMPTVAYGEKSPD